MSPSPSRLRRRLLMRDTMRPWRFLPAAKSGGGGYTWVAGLGIGRSSCKFCLDSIPSKNSMHCCYSSESTSALSRASKHGKETISQLGCVKVSQMLTELFPSWKNVSVFLRFFLFLRCRFLRAKLLSGALSQMASSRLSPARYSFSAQKQ